MKFTDKELLQRLGRGENIAEVCRAAGMDRSQFDLWWQRTIRSRVPANEGSCNQQVENCVEIARDSWGIPHILAETDRDLFFGFGFAMAQDRLFQLDYLRRKGMGRLSEILGPEGLPSDRVARTIGLNRIAAAHWEQLPADVQKILEWFSAGVNASMADSGDNLPIEFDLLDYAPEPWSPVDCVAIECEFMWYLTGRFPVIVIPELAKRQFGEGPLYRECILAEADEEAILHPGEYHPKSASLPKPVGETLADPDAGIGSNNWVIGPKKSATGQALVASDPHIAFEAVSCWYEVHLTGGSFNVAGMAYAGMPAILVGRNEQVAWGITNNICSLRDLYQEKESSTQPGYFLYGDQWEASQEIEETIEVRGTDSITETIRFSRNGPFIDDILPAAAKGTGPVTVKWLGAHHGGWLTALLAMARAESAMQLRDATEPWHVPTFSVVIADREGHIGLQQTGRIPIRTSYERGYRAGWDPQQQWQGLLPFDAMPGLVDPDRGWIATANNRVAADDYPHQLFGCWASGWRAKRIRQMVEGQPRMSLQDMRNMQHDKKSLRAVSWVPALIESLETALSAESSADQKEVRSAIEILRTWDGRVEADSVAAALFNVFFANWCRVVALERFEGDVAKLMAEGISGCAGRLLHQDTVGWFTSNDRQKLMLETFEKTLRDLEQRCGADKESWIWGELHRLPLRHVLSSRGELGKLLDHGNAPIGGDATTVSNTGCEEDFRAGAGGGYRMVADLGSSPPVLTASEAQSQSGHLGSEHYADQFEQWRTGGYHTLSLSRDEARMSAVTVLKLKPAKI